MLHVGDELVYFLADKLESTSGLTARWLANAPEGTLGPTFGPPVRVLRGQVPLAVLEKHTAHKLPVCITYCRKCVNTLKDKFVEVSGTAEIVVEGIVSAETLEVTSELNSAMVLSISQVLEEMRGEWGVGGYFGGGWELQTDAIKCGGLQYIQSSKVTVLVDIKRNKKVII